MVIKRSACSRQENSKRKNKVLGINKTWKVDKEKQRLLQRKYYHDAATGRKVQILTTNARRRAQQYKSKYCFDEELSSSEGGGNGKSNIRVVSIKANAQKEVKRKQREAKK